jgi:hypothetical protein
MVVIASALAGGRFLQIEIDPPHGIVSWSGEFLTDEGWYSKNAQLLARFGTPRNPYDSNLIVSTPVFVLITAGLFELFGVSLYVGRYTSVAASVLSLLLVYRIARRQVSNELAALATLGSAVTLHQVTYARMSIVEPLATLFSMLAIYVVVVRPNRLVNRILGLALALLAFLTKSTFLYAVVAIAGALILTAVCESRRDRRLAYRTLGAVGLLIVSTVLARTFVRYLFPEEAIVSSFAVGARFSDLSPEAVARNALRAFRYVTTSGHWTVPMVVMLAALALTSIRSIRGIPSTISLEGRIVLAWLVAGLTMFGLFRYQPPRYFYFLSFAVPLLAVLLVGGLTPSSVGRRGIGRVLLYGMVLVHCALQIPGYRTWYWRGGASSFVEMGREFASRIERDDQSMTNETVVMGPASSFVSLFATRLRPTEFSFFVALPVGKNLTLIGREDDVCTRVNHWRPLYTVGPESQTGRIVERCSHLVVREDEIGRQTVMNRYYFKSDFVLRRLTYRDTEE